MYTYICIYIYPNHNSSQYVSIPSHGHHWMMQGGPWSSRFSLCARLGSQAGCWQLFVAIETVDIPMKHGYFNHVFCGMFTGGSPWQLWMIFVVRFFESFGWVAFLKKIDPFRTMACDHRWSKSTGRGSTQAGSGGACSLSSTAFLCTCLSTFAN